MGRLGGQAVLVPAIIAALKAHGALTALLDSASAVYDGEGPNPTTGTQPAKFITVGSTSSIAADVFMAQGADNFVDIHIWHPGRLGQPVRLIASHIGAALDGVRLTLTGHRHWTGWCELLAVARDPGTNPPAMHGTVQYTGRTSA